MTTTAGRPSRGMLTIGIVELVTLAVLLVNLADGNNRAVAALVGPVHGTAYLAGVIAGWRSSLPRWRKAVTLVPGVGALIAARWQRSRGPRPGLTPRGTAGRAGGCVRPG
jgi:uncharacterized protein (DUF697 family)